MGGKHKRAQKRTRCVRCLVVRAQHSCAGPLCGPCRSVYNRVYVENLQRAKLLYIDMAKYFAGLDKQTSEGGAENLGALPAGPVPDPPREGVGSHAPFRRRAEMRLMLSAINELSIDTERLYESLSTAVEEDYNLLNTLENAGYGGRLSTAPRKLYAGNIRTVALVWPLSKYNLEARFERLVREEALEHITDPPLGSQVDFASGRVGVWYASPVSDCPELAAIPTPEEMLTAIGENKEDDKKVSGDNPQQSLDLGVDS